jgi:hypothetical protein
MVFIQIERTIEIAIVISGLTITKIMIIIISLVDIRMTGTGDIRNITFMVQIISTKKKGTMTNIIMMSTNIEEIDQIVINIIIDGMIIARER